MHLFTVGFDENSLVQVKLRHVKEITIFNFSPKIKMSTTGSFTSE
jgi:hypothetical protein